MIATTTSQTAWRLPQLQVDQLVCHQFYSGVTIQPEARGALLNLLRSELQGKQGLAGAWREVVGVTKEEYLARLLQNQPVVKLKEIGAEQQVDRDIGTDGGWVSLSK